MPMSTPLSSSRLECIRLRCSNVSLFLLCSSERWPRVLADGHSSTAEERNARTSKGEHAFVALCQRRALWTRDVKMSVAPSHGRAGQHGELNPGVELAGSRVCLSRARDEFDEQGIRRQVQYASPCGPHAADVRLPLGDFRKAAHRSVHMFAGGVYSCPSRLRPLPPHWRQPTTCGTALRRSPLGCLF
jgi:hypothetical protein